MANRHSQQSDQRQQAWKVCLECGNRFEVRKSKSNQRWCSVRCQTASYRAGRDRVERSWAMRARWWLR